MSTRIGMLASAVALAGLVSCGGERAARPEQTIAKPDRSGAVVVEVAASERQWTGLTISEDGRLFVNYPRWSPDVPVSVAEIVDGAAVAYPDAARNAWSVEGGDPSEQFVCVQSVVADGRGSLWILDPGNPGFRGVVSGGAKLMRVRLETGNVERIYRFDAPVIKAASYLNDVRIDLEAQVAYITDSGDGAIVVTDLESGESRRLLDAHPSTEAEDVVLTIEGKEWRGPDGSAPRVHADGIALTPDKQWLYYHALTGRTLYRVPTSALRDAALSEHQIGETVETVAATGAADGLIFGLDGRLYISALEENAIKRYDPATGQVDVVVQGDMIRWPDTFTLDPSGRVHFTTAQIHLGASVTEPYRIFRIEE
jgi:sugar lactone lactonase YvrE